MLPFLFSLVFAIIWDLFPPPSLPSHQSFTFRWASIWIIAFADDLAVACPSAPRLSHCLTRLRNALEKLWLIISLKKTEVVTFTAQCTRRLRRVCPIRIGQSIVPTAFSFKYLGVHFTISANGQLQTHQKAVFARAKVSAHEVAKLMRKLEVTSLPRLSSYLQAFVDSQFYGIELFPLHVALDVDKARKIYLCSCFELPTCSATALT